MDLTQLTEMARAAKERADKATPGPWKRGSWAGKCIAKHDHARDVNDPAIGQRNCNIEWTYRVMDGDNGIILPEGRVLLSGWDDWGELLNTPDAEFIAAARQDVPALADAIEKLVARVRELEGQRLLPARHSPPYQFILAEAAIRGWSDQELAHSLLIYPLGTGKDWVVEWLQNKRIDDDFASILAATFGASPDLWLNLQRNYDTWLAAKKKGSEGQG